MKLVVFGAAGRTGRHVVAHALRSGHEVTAFARNPARLHVVGLVAEAVSGDPLRRHLEAHGRVPALTPAQEDELVHRMEAGRLADGAAGTTPVPVTKVEVADGDARDAELVERAVAGRDGVISVLALPSGEREFELSLATSVIVGAAVRTGVRRLILTACEDVLRDEEVTGDRAPYAREDERNRDELRTSGLDWTIGAAPRVTGDSSVGSFQTVIDAKAPGDWLAAADLAMFTLDALEQDEWIGHIVGVSN
jgi:uncharacterized protein YbjT (DUF2867 family)